MTNFLEKKYNSLIEKNIENNQRPAIIKEPASVGSENERGGGNER